ncbi:MAG: 3-methyl-2-oxobutanoate hydroxymethyltransferase, partial [Planctomycetes bacterium]|nr:3-methyl-2-oxobutanoate hydroxymethyltransferase [Planctomycetota bacterium]
DCDGQILIINDLQGLSEGKLPKFSKAFGQMAEPITAAIVSYAQQVRTGVFPDDAHCYHIRSGELEKLEAIVSASRGQL